jgi:hypothetical protein
MDKWQSRKYISAWRLTYIATALLACPAILGIKIPAIAAITLLTGDQWVMVVGFIWGGYFAANVTEKHKSFVASGAPNSSLEITDVP